MPTHISIENFKKALMSKKRESNGSLCAVSLKHEGKYLEVQFEKRRLI